jgi:hypothetical protein
LYPNYDTHVDRNKMVGLIEDQGDIKKKNQNMYKKIYYVDEHVHKTMEYINVFQSFKLLKMTLDYQEISPSHQLTFVKDEE